MATVVAQLLSCLDGEHCSIPQATFL